jgi:hypothetical protein
MTIDIGQMAQFRLERLPLAVFIPGGELPGALGYACSEKTRIIN